MKGSIKYSLFVIGALIALLAIFYFSFMNDNKDVQHQLVGSWLRMDGNYKIEIQEVAYGGKLHAAYFNPNPINVGRSSWRIKNNIVQIYVELQDKDYPGSLYQLDFDDKTNTLKGTYYQAVSK